MTIKKLFGLFIAIVLLIGCNNTNAFFASGSTVDIENPVINVDSDTLGAVIRGVVSFTGTAHDDVWVKTVDMYYISVGSDASGDAAISDVWLASTDVKGKETTWSISFDTRVLPDAGTIFRFRITDEADKYTYKNITVQLDNYGPDMIISTPTANTNTNPISNTFLAAVIPVEIEENVITRIDWKLSKLDDESVSISGTEDLSADPKAANETYQFIIDPFPLSRKDGFEIGFYHLEVCGYSAGAGTLYEYGRASRQWACSDNLYLDFSSSVPIISLTSPTSTDPFTPTPQSSDAIVGLALVDDDGVAAADIKWGKLTSNGEIGDESQDTITFADAPKSKTVVYTIKDLAPGTYWVQARASDIKPNTSAWTEVHYFRIDNTMPSIKWNSPEQGSWHKGGTVTLNAEVTISGEAAITRLEYRFTPDGTEWHEVKESSAVDTSSVSHKITADSQNVTFVGKILESSAVYANGGEAMFSLKAYKNESDFTESALLLNFDSMKPDITITQPAADDNLNQTIRISGTALDFTGENRQTPGIIKDLSIDLSWGSGSTSIPMNDIVGVSGWSVSFDTWAAGVGMMQGGENLRITVKAADHAGNINQEIKDVTVDQSTDIPTVSIDNFHDGEKKYGIFTVSGRAADDDSVRLVQAYLTDNVTDPISSIVKNSTNLITGLIGDNAWANCSGTDTWTYKLDLSAMNNGTHRFICRSIDVNGKPSTYGGVYNFVTFFVDPDIPQIDLDLDPYINGPVSFEATASKTASDSPDVYISKVEYKIVGSSSQTGWVAFDAAHTVMTQNNQIAKVTLPYTAAMINTFGQGDVTISIRATDSSDKQNEASDIVFVDTKKLNAALQTEDSLIVRTGTLRLQGGISDEEPSSGIYNNDCSVKYTFDGTNYEQALSGVQIGSLSNYDVNWAIPPTVKDGIISIKLDAKDRAGNGIQNESNAVISNVRLCRYPPQFSLITINDIAAADYMSVKKNISISMTVTDKDVNDTADKGVKKIGAYLLTASQHENYSQDKAIASGWKVIQETTYPSPAEIQEWTADFSFTTDYDYILFRATDVSDSWRDVIYKITIDSQSPIADFTYSSVGYYNGDSHKYVSRTYYSDTLWIKLDAKDKIRPTDEYTPLTGTYIYLGVGTASTNNDILGEKIYLAGSGIAKLDLKGYTGTIYVNYRITDAAGNVTQNSIPLTRSASLPTIDCTLGNKWLNSAGLNNVTATSTNSTVKYSAVGFDTSDGQINLLTLGSNMYNTDSDKINVVAANGGSALTDESEFNITLIATKNADGLDVYETRTFTYDNTKPTFNDDLVVAEDVGAKLGRVNGSRLSGVVTFSGTFTDGTLGAKESASDFTMTVTVAGNNAGTVTDIVKTGETDGSGHTIFAWTWQYDTSSASVDQNISFEWTLKDKADNEKSISKTYDIVPCIRSITEVSGSIAAINRYGTAYDGASVSLCSTNYDEMYSYRLGSTNIVISGFNLSGVAYKYSGGTVSPTSTTATSATLPSGSFTKTGILTAEKSGVSSDPKTIRVFKNYTVGSNVYQSVAETDMTVSDDNKAIIVFQNHYTSKSAVLRDYETSEGTFAKTNLYDNNSVEHIMRGYNRWWFICIAKDIGTPTTQSYLPDTKYYLLNCDTEFNNNNGAQKGLLLTGNTSGWTTLLGKTRNPYNNDTILMPYNDWNSTGTPGTNLQYANRWRMSAKNDENSRTNEPNNIPAGAADWSCEWGDVCAYSDKVHTVWHSQFDNHMYYRGMNNKNQTDKNDGSLKFPDAGAVNFDFNGKQPSVTVDKDGNPVIICYKDTGSAATSGLYVYYSSDTAPNSQTWGSSFTEKCVVTGTGVGQYPRIALDSDNHVYIFYQDAPNAALMYVYADSLASLSTSSSRMIVDTDCAPGYYNDIRVVDGQPVCTYLASGLLGSGNAVRAARYVDSTFTEAAYTDRANWEIVTLPCAHNITENKVRGFVIEPDTSVDNNWLFAFAKSSDYGPEFFREKK